MQQRVRTINLEDDRPTVAQALARLELELRLARKQGVWALKIIHGFGSTGNGGKIRVAVRRELEGLSGGRVAFYVPGERLSIFEAETRELLRLFPEFRRDRDIDRHNNGVTVVVLRTK